jgi:hypothetical protein
MLAHPGVQSGEDMANESVAMPGQPVVHPFPVPPSLDQSGALHLREMPRDLGLIDAQGAVQIANAHLAVSEQIQEAQPGRIGKCFKKLVRRDRFSVLHEHTYTLVRICMSNKYMRVLEYVIWGAQAASLQ